MPHDTIGYTIQDSIKKKSDINQMKVSKKDSITKESFDTIFHSVQGREDSTSLSKEINYKKYSPDSGVIRDTRPVQSNKQIRLDDKTTIKKLQVKSFDHKIIYKPSHEDVDTFSNLVVQYPDWPLQDMNIVQKIKEEKPGATTIHTPVYVPEKKDNINDQFLLLNTEINKTDFYINSLRKKKNISSDWMLGIIVLIFVFLAWIKLFFSKYLNQILNSTHNYQLSYKLYRDRNILLKRVSFILNIVFILVGGLFVYQVFDYYRIIIFRIHPIYNYLIFSSSLMTVYFVKGLTNRLVGILFLQQSTLSEYMFNVYLYNKVVGLTLLPIIIGLRYMSSDFSRILIYIGFSIIVLNFIFRYFRGIRIILKKDFLLFYLILYLCTLEFLPLALMYKILNNLI